MLIRRTAYLIERALLINQAALANQAGRSSSQPANLADTVVEEEIEAKAARTIAGMVIARA
ncbi:MAG: hypothetical protein R2845_02365 [Thermomicrobiales bacterium]